MQSRVLYYPHDITKFISQMAHLNDECINSVALLLQSHFIQEFEHSSVVILTTHNLVQIRYGASNKDIWRNTKHSEYWNKSIWVLPIHCKEAHHWVCIIYPLKEQIHLMDIKDGSLM